MADKYVTTYNGEKYLRSECRYISGKFYKMGTQCFKMSDGKWHRINNGLIDFDHETKHWVLKSGVNLYKGVIGFDDDGNPIRGSFTRNLMKNEEIIEDKYSLPKLVISENIIPKNKYVEILSTGSYIKKDLIQKFGYRPKSKEIGKRYPFRLNYSFEGQFLAFKDFHEKYFEYKSNPLKKFYKELGDTTFGVEFETYDGQIPLKKIYRSGLIPLRDGSLRHDGVSPFEYTTIPLSKENGLHTIKECCNLLNKYCINSANGSTHVHLGNIERTPEYGMAMYRLLFHIQDEIYNLFPKYFRNTSKFKNTGKDYCQPLPELSFKQSFKKNFDGIFKFYTNNMELYEEDYYMGMPHPQDGGFEHKYYVNQRYRFVNLIPLFFNNRGTVEFRIHTSTFNHDKVINWIFITNAICRYAEKYQTSISRKGTKLANLNTILNEMYSKELSSYLISYISFRKCLMKKHSEAGDYIGAKEVKFDSLKEWNYPIKSLI